MIDLALLRQHIPSHVRVAVAYSGGVDSTALLYACQQANIPLLAIHINHQMQTLSNDWQFHCEAFCRQHNIPFEARTVQVNRQGGESLEEIARQARYTAIAQVMHQHDIAHLLTAHHEDDQIETVLIALFRGSGFAGLAGMPVQAPWPFGLKNGIDGRGAQVLSVIRPLLATKRSELCAYVALHDIAFVEDPSNTNLEYRRNWLRHCLVPELEKIFPQYRTSIRRLAGQVADIRQEWDEQATQLLRVCSDDLNRLSLIEWKKYSVSVRVRVMRAWLARHNIRLNQAQSLELERQLCVSKGGVRQVSSICKLSVKSAWVQCITNAA